MQRFLGAMAAHDWAAMAACLTDDVRRVGPYRDVYEGKEAYVAFLSELLPTLPGYAMDVARIVYAADGSVAVAELSETVDDRGTPLRTPEALVFDLDEGGLIRHIAIHTQESERL